MWPPWVADNYKLSSSVMHLNINYDLSAMYVVVSEYLGKVSEQLVEEFRGAADSSQLVGKKLVSFLTSLPPLHNMLHIRAVKYTFLIRWITGLLWSHLDASRLIPILLLGQKHSCHCCTSAHFCQLVRTPLCRLCTITQDDCSCVFSTQTFYQAVQYVA